MSGSPGSRRNHVTSPINKMSKSCCNIQEIKENIVKELRNKIQIQHEQEVHYLKEKFDYMDKRVISLVI